ncbi:MAG: hypothetical protein ACJ8J0_02360 [Longimicrobiaceae bacterium]
MSLPSFVPATRAAAAGRRTPFGTSPPDEGVPAAAYIDALRERGVVIEETRLEGAAANG